MAITVTPNLTQISDCESTSGWSGGATNASFQLQGSNCLGEKVSNVLQTVRTYTFGSNQNMTNKFIIMTMLITGKADTKANGGYRIYVEDSSGNNGTWYVAGSDTHPGGWGYFVVDPSTTPTSGSGTINVASIAKVGVQMKTLSTSLGNNANAFWDICWYGTGLKITSGTTDGATFEDFATADDTNFYGIIQKINGVYFVQGALEIGDTSTSIDFDDDGSIVVWKDNEFLPDSLNKLIVNGYSAGTVNVNIKNGVLYGSGTVRPYIDLSDANIDDGNLSGETFIHTNDISLTGMDTISGCSFDDCYQVTIGASPTLSGSTFRNCVDTGGALLWPSDDTNISDLTFINCDNGVEYASGSDSTPTFDNLSFDDVSGNYDVNNSSGSAISITLSNGSNANSYTGSTVTFISGVVTVGVTVQYVTDSSIIEGARVLVLVASGINYPYQDSVSLSRSGTTVTVTHTGHGLASNDYVEILGANESDYNGVHQITVINSGSYSYEITGTPTTPATGTIVATFAPIFGTTNSSGYISASKSYTSNQPITGKVRYSTPPGPYYKSSPIAGTIDNTAGLQVTIQMIPDE